MNTSTPLRRRIAPLVLAVAAGAVVLAGCGATAQPAPRPPSAAGAPSSGVGSPAPSSADSRPSAAAESNPPGDIPDNQAFVAYQGSGWQVKVPEGWSQTRSTDGTVTFTDKLNAVRVSARSGAPQPSVSSVKAAVTRAEGSRPGFALERVDTVTRAAGTAYRATYRVDGQPDPVTGKTVNNDVESYTFARGGTQVEIRLSGPHGADNVDPWKIVTDSFRWA